MLVLHVSYCTKRPLLLVLFKRTKLAIAKDHRNLRFALQNSLLVGEPKYSNSYPCKDRVELSPPFSMAHTEMQHCHCYRWSFPHCLAPHIIFQVCSVS